MEADSTPYRIGNSSSIHRFTEQNDKAKYFMIVLSMKMEHLIKIIQEMEHLSLDMEHQFRHNNGSLQETVFFTTNYNVIKNLFIYHNVESALDAFYPPNSSSFCSLFAVLSENDTWL
jgi:hypothetical protein